MREYVLFVILIFIPIGLVLYHFLRREGLPKKDINIILILALLIIFSFPICMERLGIYFSLLLYLLIIGALVAYLLRTGESLYLETAFASLRNLRQRPELIIKTEPGLTGLNYEQLSEITLDRLDGVAEQSAEAIQSVKAEDIEARLNDIEPATTIDIVEDVASEPEAFRIEAKSVEEIGREAEKRAAEEMVEDSIAAAITEKLVEEYEESLNEPIELKQTPEATADELVEEMVARLAAKIEAMPETLPQVRDIEGLAEEHAELAAVVENVKDVIAEAAVKIEVAHTLEIVEKTTAEDGSETSEVSEQAVAEEEAAVDLETAKDAANENMLQLEAALTEEIVKETAGEEVPEFLEIPQTVNGEEEETTKLAAEAETAVNIDIAEDVAVEAVDQVEAAPAEEIAEEVAAEDMPEALEVPQTVNGEEEETTKLAAEAETAVNIDIGEDVAVEIVDQVEAAPAEEIAEEVAAEDMPEALGIPEIVVELETVVTVEAGTLLPEVAPTDEIVGEVTVEDASEALEGSDTVVVEQGIDIVAASDIEMVEETIPGADDVQIEILFAGEIAEEEPAPKMAEVREIPEPTMVVKDTEVLSEEIVTPEISEVGAEFVVVSEGIMKESSHGEDVAEDIAEPVAEIKEAHDLSSEEIEVQPDQAAQSANLDMPKEPDIIETSETRPDEAAEGEDGHDAETALAAVEGEVNRLVDMAFHYKTIGDIPAAIEAFVKVWNKVENDELRYLITMEMVDLYKECGYYNYAEQVLGNYLELGGHKSDIIYEINRQLNGIRFLATELTRLGMSGAPWAQVPRWIRMELEDALNQ